MDQESAGFPATTVATFVGGQRRYHGGAIGGLG
jgi:hypothetical protein